MTTLELERTASEILTGGRIHATVAAAHVQWVRDYHGDDAVKELFWRLDRDAAHELTAEGAWISFASLIALDRAIVQKFGRGRRGFLRELGRYSAYLNLAGHATSNSSVPLCALCASVVNPHVPRTNAREFTTEAQRAQRGTEELHLPRIYEGSVSVRCGWRIHVAP